MNSINCTTSCTGRAQFLAGSLDLSFHKIQILFQFDCSYYFLNFCFSPFGNQDNFKIISWWLLKKIIKNENNIMLSKYLHLTSLILKWKKKCAGFHFLLFSLSGVSMRKVEQNCPFLSLVFISILSGFYFQLVICLYKLANGMKSLKVFDKLLVILQNRIKEWHC